MKVKIKANIVRNLRNLADSVEQDKSNLIELSFEKHHNSRYIFEKGLYEHKLTGDNMIIIRFK